MNQYSSNEDCSSKLMIFGSNSEISPSQDPEAHLTNVFETKDQKSDNSFESETKGPLHRNLLNKGSNLANLVVDKPSKEADSPNFQLSDESGNPKTDFSFEQKFGQESRVKSQKELGKQN